MGLFELNDLSPTQFAGYVTASQLWEQRDEMGLEALRNCGQVIRRGPWAGRRCPNPAGQGTWLTETSKGKRDGFGRCVVHGGAKRAGRALGAWLMAHKFAEELDLTPWEALLYVVRITAGRVRYCEQVLAQATDDRELEGKVHEGEPTGVSEHGELMQGRNLSWWVETSERERMMLARVSKAAIDAGVAQLMIEREMRMGEELAMILTRTIDALDSAGIPQAQLSMIRDIMGRELREMDGGGDKHEGVKVIEGEHG